MCSCTRILLICCRWTEAWRRLKLVREAAALDMTNADVLSALCASLLRCEQWRLAKKYLGGTASTPLDCSTAEALVLGHAKELLSSAADVGYPEVGQACFQMPCHAVQSQAESASAALWCQKHGIILGHNAADVPVNVLHSF